LWQLDRVIVDGGAGEAAWAIGYWDGEPVIATRWNGTKDGPNGMPYSRAPVWYIINSEAFPALMAYLASENPGQAVYVRDFLRLPAAQTTR